MINESILKCAKYIDRVCPSEDGKFNPLNIDKLFKLESCKLIHQLLNNDIPSALNNLFQRHISSKISRKNSMNNVSTIHYDQSFHPLMFYAPQFWNQAGLELRKNIDTAKNMRA